MSDDDEKKRERSEESADSDTGGEDLLEELHRTQGDKDGLAALVGKWPGDETDEEIKEALRKMS